MDARRALLSPSASARIEHAWRFFQKSPLLLWGELNHPMVVVGITERGENLAADAEVRVVHVRGLDRTRNLERHAAKFICGHGKAFRPTTDIGQLFIEGKASAAGKGSDKLKGTCVRSESAVGGGAVQNMAEVFGGMVIAKALHYSAIIHFFSTPGLRRYRCGDV